MNGFYNAITAYWFADKKSIEENLKDYKKLGISEKLLKNGKGMEWIEENVFSSVENDVKVRPLPELATTQQSRSVNRSIRPGKKSPKTTKESKSSSQMQTDVSDNNKEFLKESTKSLIKKYNSIFEENKELWNKNYENPLKKHDVDSKLVETLKYLIAGATAPLSEKSKIKYATKVQKIMNGFDSLDNKQKQECTTQLYELAVRAVNHLYNVVKKSKSGKLSKFTHKAGKIVRKLGKVLDKGHVSSSDKSEKLSSIEQKELPIGGLKKCFDETESKKLGKASSNDQTPEERLQIKKLGKCFKEAGRYIVKFKFRGFKKKNLINIFKKWSGDSSLGGWYDLLESILNNNTTLSKIAIDDDVNKEYKKGSVAVLLASLCGLPNNKYVVSACDGLKEGGLKGNFKEDREYLNQAIAIYKKVKTKALSYDTSDSLKQVFVKENWNTLVGKFDDFKNNVVGKFKNGTEQC